MTQEEKDLLLRDLCARLPYDVKVDIIYSKDSGSSLRARLCCEGINTLDTNILWLFQQSEVYIKPYLFPMSSMTEEQRKEMHNYSTVIWDNSIDSISYEDRKIYCAALEIEWLDKNHFDYRGLIPLGLALDATNLNIY